MKPGTIHKVYVGASSQEIERAAMWTDKIREAGFEVTSTWIDNIAKHSPGDPNSRDAIDTDRASWSNTNLAQVRYADLLWLLVPTSKEGHGHGGYYEAGHAHALDKHLVFSGDTKQSIFTSMGQEFADDLSAFARICAMRVGR